MKAMKGNPFDGSNNRRRFFRKPIEPNICRLEKVSIDDDALEEYIEFAGNDLFTSDVRATLKEFEEADNFGSLIQPTLKEPTKLLETLESKNALVDLFLKDTHESILKILKQAKYLSSVYHVSVANPPYLASKGMNGRLNNWAKSNYPDSKFDLFTMFMERTNELLLKSGYSAMINMQSWMFLSSFEKLRLKLLKNSTITTMAHLGPRAFDSIAGEVVSTTAFVLKNGDNPTYKGCYLRLVKGRSELDKQVEFKNAIEHRNAPTFYSTSPAEFAVIEGKPITYWISEQLRQSFLSGTPLIEVAQPRKGVTTADNDKYLRNWFEVSSSSLELDKSKVTPQFKSIKTWFLVNKGGEYRKWYGNNDIVINWKNNGEEIKSFENAVVRNPKFYFKEGMTWNDISTGDFAMRYSSGLSMFEGKGPMAFAEDHQQLLSLIGFFNSKVSSQLLSYLSPTVNFNIGELSKVPILEEVLDSQELQDISNRCISISKQDYDTNELSVDFAQNKLVFIKNTKICNSLEQCINEAMLVDTDTLNEMTSLEERNNQILIDLYGLQDEISYVVPKKEITLTINQNEKGNKTSSTDYILDLISYAIGNIFGRYSVNKDGLIIGSQNETLNDYLNRVTNPLFIPDVDNVIPIIDFEGDWFEDDIAERFKEFLKVTFGEENFAENLAFIEDAIGKDIKKYFVKDFYADHVKRYKKRPIYWMFSSPKGSFNALIYMHRYQPDTVSIVLNDYLREFRTKLEARKESYEQVEISASASQKDKTNAIKAISKINKVLEEINDYEHDILYPLAGEKKEIDLDDGVKHNYPLFGKALKKITGLS